MSWANDLVGCLKASEVSLISYVPDSPLYHAIQLMERDPYFRVVPATREEEAIGIAAGAYSAGRNAAVFMQSSGFGNCINALASLCISYRIPIPMIINLRGQLDEKIIVQIPMGRATRPIMDVLGIPHYTLDDPDTLTRIVSGALTLCYTSRQPVGLCTTPLLHGGKRVE